MAQVSSNTLVYEQIFIKIREFLRQDFGGVFKTIEEKSTAYNKLIQDIYDNLASPLTEFQPLIKGEPPISSKMNGYASGFADDLNIIARQIDYLTAKTVNVFNLFQTEIENEKKYLERIGSKSKILQMYTKSPANDLVYLGDSFDNMDKVDVTRIRQRYVPAISNGQATLPVTGSRILTIKSIYINKEFGFLGNTHQVRRATNSEGTSEYRYIFEDTPGIGQLSSLKDSNPLTFFELEVLDVDKESAGAERALVSENEFCFLRDVVTNTESRTELVNWSEYDMTKPLEASFVLEVNPGNANVLEIVPYFASGAMLKINQVTLTRKDGTRFNILKDPIFIGTSFTPLNLEMSKNYFYNKAVINFAETEITQAEIFCQQDGYQNIEIGHSYWKPNYPSNSNVNSPFFGLSRFNPDSLNRDIYEEIEYDRFALLPKSIKPNEYKVNGSITKELKVRLKTKNKTYNFWVITFDRDNISDSPDAGSVKSYFLRWIRDINNPSFGFNFVDEVRFSSPTINVKYFSSEVEGQADLDAFKSYIESLPNDEIEVGNSVFNVKNIKLERLTFVDNGYVYNYSVPVISQREIYQAKRMAIGFRDITFRHDTYANQAEIVSKPFMFDKNVEALMLSSEVDIDQSMADQVGINYYLSVDGNQWIKVSPVQLDANGTAEVLSFNKNLTESAKLPGVAYLNSPAVPNIIKQVLVKIEFGKSRAVNITPSIYSYELIAKVES